MLLLYIRKMTSNQSRIIAQYLSYQFVLKYLKKYFSINFTHTSLLMVGLQKINPVSGLVILVNEIHKSFDQRNSYEVRSIFLDISKAFDKVWHEGLIQKSNQNGICGNALISLRGYLKVRRQRVVINGHV